MYVCMYYTILLHTYNIYMYGMYIFVNSNIIAFLISKFKFNLFDEWLYYYFY